MWKEWKKFLITHNQKFILLRDSKKVVLNMGEQNIS